MNNTDDAVLIKQCLQENPQAFEILVDRYQKVIFNLAYRISGNLNDAEDITQAVFIKVFENLRRYNEKFKFFSWLYRIAVNEALNVTKFRKKTDSLNGQHPSADSTPDFHYQKLETERLVQDALMCLKSEYRMMITLKHFQNLSYQDIAHILNITEKKVKSRLYTARHVLADILTGKGILTHEGK